MGGSGFAWTRDGCCVCCDVRRLSMDVDVFCWAVSCKMGFVRDDFREVNVPYSTSTSPDASRTAWIRGHRRVSNCLGVGSDVMVVGFWSVAHQDVRPYFQIIRPSFLGSSSSLFGSACDSGVTKIEGLAFRHRFVCSLSYTWSKRSIPTLLTPSIQLRAAVYFTRDHVLCASFLHSFVTMTAISCAPTVRATAAPKVAIRRTNVRAAATGIRTQFGAVKGFAPVG